MSIEFRCSQCQKLLRTGDETAGKHARCPQCGTVMDIPQSSTAGPSTPPAGSVPPSEPPGPLGAPPGDPDNPYQSPTGFVPGPGPSLMPQGPVRPTPIDFGDVMGRAWVIFKDRMGICIGAALFVFLISGIPTFISLFVRFTDPRLANDVTFALGLNAFSFVWALPSIWLGIGQAILFLKIARGQPADFGDLFSGGPFFLTALLAWILFNLAVGTGFCLCIVPGVILALIFFQFLYLIVDQRLDVIEALLVSNQITTGNKATLFLLWLVLPLLAVCTCLLGLIFVIPFGQVVWAVAYLTMTGQPTAEQMQMPPGPQPVV